jgi:hypothetical protein
VCGTSGKLDKFSKQLQSCNLDIVMLLSFFFKQNGMHMDLFFLENLSGCHDQQMIKRLELSGKVSLRAFYMHSNEDFFRLLKTNF